MYWAKFWAIFSQPHLVTLQRNNPQGQAVVGHEALEQFHRNLATT
jgi:hypothetical protein